MVTMHITLPTSVPGEVYRDRGTPRAVFARLRNSSPAGATVKEAATAAKAAGVRAEYNALCILLRVIRTAGKSDNAHIANKATALTEEIWKEGLMSCHLPTLRALIAKSPNLPRRAA